MIQGATLQLPRQVSFGVGFVSIFTLCFGSLFGLVSGFLLNLILLWGRLQGQRMDARGRGDE